MNRTYLPSTTGILYGLFNLGSATSLGEEKTQNSNSTQKSALYRTLVITLNFGKYVL